ncbi:MAG: hypothetical protein INF75_00245 [Roseomonas sp.]|nr:hypothetical protein [Roseomonas sp.]MCA3327681.1 hypothetical protein [Roseomonas sp.]MCA3330690.1 hypothetical protein [Roseomonas sp.]MCA3334179.1 hypothetical protein [Roseomonas sp.]MCA3346721.1 hypothetical protein [Roseomonas sp.]
MAVVKTQIWIAAGLALICSWISTGFANFFVRILAEQIISALGGNSAVASLLVSIISAFILAAALEVSKFIALIWLLRRRWDQWAPLGAVFGFIYAGSLLLRWIVFGLRPDTDISVYAGFIYLATKIALLHWALGRLAAAAAIRPGGPWFALLTVSLASTLTSLLPLQLASFLIDLPIGILTAPQWLLEVPFILFILAVWKWLPTPLAHQAYGPARWIALILALFLVFISWSLLVGAAFFGPARIDIFSLLFVTVAAGFMVVMLYRNVLRPWALRSGLPDK